MSGRSMILLLSWFITIRHFWNVLAELIRGRYEIWTCSAFLEKLSSAVQETNCSHASLVLICKHIQLVLMYLWQVAIKTSKWIFNFFPLFTDNILTGREMAEISSPVNIKEKVGSSNSAVQTKMFVTHISSLLLQALLTYLTSI